MASRSSRSPFVNHLGAPWRLPRKRLCEAVVAAIDDRTMAIMAPGAARQAARTDAAVRSATRAASRSMLDWPTGGVIRAFPYQDGGYALWRFNAFNLDVPAGFDTGT